MDPPERGTIKGRWNAFWFAPGSAETLGICRLVYVSILLWTLPISGIGAVSLSPDALWRPTPLFEWIGLTAAPAAALRTMGAALSAALVFSAIGFLTRLSCLIAAVLSFYLLGLRECYGVVYHSTSTIPLMLLVLAAGRSGDAWSVESLLGRLLGRTPARERVAAGEYTWPVRLAQTYAALVFFAAGVAKLRHGGFAWIFSGNLREILIGEHYLATVRANPIGLQVAEHVYLCMLAALVVVAAEALAPWALVSKPARAVIVPALFVFNASLSVFFGFTFAPLLATFVFWIPWSAAAGALRRL
jgi:hypothetical protein